MFRRWGLYFLLTGTLSLFFASVTWGASSAPKVADLSEVKVDGTGNLKGTKNKDKNDDCRLIKGRLFALLLRLGARGSTLALDAMNLSVLNEASQHVDTFGDATAVDIARGVSIANLVVQGSAVFGDLYAFVNSKYDDKSTQCSVTCDVFSTKMAFFGQWLPIHLAIKSHNYSGGDGQEATYVNYMENLEDSLYLSKMAFLPRVLGILPSCCQICADPPKNEKT